MKATKRAGFCFILASSSLALCATVGWAAEPISLGPPAFVTLPIHAAEQLQQRVEGWLTFQVGRKPSGLPGGGTGGGGGITAGTADFSLDEQKTLLSEVSTLSPPRNPYQGETVITFVPASGLLVGGFNSIDPGNCSASLGNCAPGAVSSNNSSSTTWQQSTIPINGNLVGYDPSLAVDADGKTIYYAYGVCSGSCRSGNLRVATSTDGFDWGLGFDVTPPLSGIFDDKPWIAADPTTSGTAYVAWDRNQGNDQILYVSKTTDHGAHWTNPIKINDGTSTHERVIYAMPTVSPVDGTVYVVWMDYARKALFVDKSTDGGVTWGPDQQVTALNVTFTDIGCNGGRSMTPAPYIAVDTNGRVYVSYADELKSGSGMDVYLVYFNGQKWSIPYRINDVTTGHQYNPAMNVVGTTVYVSWLDRRNDPNNCKTQTFSTYSDGTLDTSGAPKFSTNHNVSDNTPGSNGTANQSDYDGNPNGPGDYSGVVGGVPATGSTTSTAAAEYPLWPTHFASGDSFDIYTAEVQP